MRPIIIRADKADQFLKQKRDTNMLIAKFERLKRIELLSGKSPNDPEILQLSKRIRELKNERI